MLKQILLLLMFIFSCGDNDNKKNVTDNNTDGKPPTTTPLPIELDLAVVGDSLATGFFSDGKLGQSMTQAEALAHPIIKGMMFPGQGKTSTASFDSNLKQKFENPYTCAENTEESQCSFSYQKRAGLAHDKVKNEAVSGSTVSDIIVQLNQIEKAGNAKTYIVQVGGNDFCDDNFEQTEYVNGMRKVIDKILGANSKAQIIVVAIPDIIALYETVATADDEALTLTNISNQVIIQTLELGEKREVTFLCKHVRDGEKITDATPDIPVFCPRISDADISDAETTTELFATKKSELQAANKAIADLVSGYSNTNIKFAASVAELAFTKEDITADCVHPSSAGQQKLAKEVWKYKF